MHNYESVSIHNQYHQYQYSESISLASNNDHFWSEFYEILVFSNTNVFGRFQIRHLCDWVKRHMCDMSFRALSTTGTKVCTIISCRIVNVSHSPGGSLSRAINIESRSKGKQCLRTKHTLTQCFCLPMLAARVSVNVYACNVSESVNTSACMHEQCVLEVHAVRMSVFTLYVPVLVFLISHPVSCFGGDSLSDSCNIQ